MFYDSSTTRAFLLMIPENMELLNENGGAMPLNSISLKLTDITGCPQYAML